jgi:hypothetical protein
MRRQWARPVTEAERKERLGYVVLQHLDTLVDEAAGNLETDNIAADLAIPPEELRDILDMLTVRGLIDWDGTRGLALPTPRGSDYLARVADRRRSVRFNTIGRRGQSANLRPSTEAVRYRDPRRAPGMSARPDRRAGRNDGD